MTINNHSIEEKGSLKDFSDWVIERDESLSLDYKAELPAQSQVKKESTGYLVFTQSYYTK